MRKIVETTCVSLFFRGVLLDWHERKGKGLLRAAVAARPLRACAGISQADAARQRRAGVAGRSELRLERRVARRHMGARAEQSIVHAG